MTAASLLSDGAFAASRDIAATGPRVIIGYENSDQAAELIAAAQAIVDAIQAKA